MTAVVGEERAPADTASPAKQQIWAWFAPLLAAVQFLTVAPSFCRRPFTPRELGRAVGWFPLVGLLLGLLLAGLDRTLGLVFVPGVTAALVLVAWVVATGALHLDGFLDSCDGLFGGRTPEARLRIMRDERAGAFAVVGGVLLLLVKYAALAGIADRLAVLIVAPVLGRWAMALAVVAFPYARAEGLGRDIKNHARWPQAVLAVVTAGLAAGLAGGWRGLAALTLASVMPWLAALFVRRRLPGFTGDIYGALCEMVEALVLLVFVAEVAT
jgi:adenosylcobinamide-GDP ribazoletransferase